MANKTGVRGKLIPGQVKRMREYYATKKYTMARLARKYGIHQTTVSHIVRGEAYKDVEGPISRVNWHNCGNVENFRGKK